MAESTRPDELEGWRVRWRWGVGLTAAFYALIALAIGVTFALYRQFGQPHVNVRPAQTLPAPRLNERLDSDPHWSFAPPDPEERGPDPQVWRAMNQLAAEGDAGYASPRRAP